MKIIFFDTEFDNFADLGLISIGFISECEKYQFYIENKDLPSLDCSDFVKQNVIPLLNLEQYGKDYKSIPIKLKEWIESIEDNEIIFLSDYQGDEKILWKLLRNININKRISSKLIYEYLPQATKERLIYDHRLMQKTMEIILSTIATELKKQPEMQHHALYDAKCNCIGWKNGISFLNNRFL